MHAKSLEKIAELFMGKVVTIIMPIMNRQFRESQAIDYFTCRIIEIDSDGIVGQHPLNKTKSYLRWDYIMSIHEEFELDSNNPDHADLIKQFEEKTGKKVESEIKKITPPVPPKEESEYVNIDELEDLVEQNQKNCGPNCDC